MSAANPSFCLRHLALSRLYHAGVPNPSLPRCSWAHGDDALMAKYHDEEWGIPQRDPRMLWEMLMLEGFQGC